MFKEKGKVPVVVNSSINNGIGGYTNLPPTEKGNLITYTDTTTSEGIFYQPQDFVGYSHIQGLYAKSDLKWNENSLLYFLTVFKNQARGRFDYARKFNRKIAADMIVKLPITQNNEINFEFIESFMKELKRERIEKLKQYIKAQGLDNNILTIEEQEVIDNFNRITWENYNLEMLFGKSTRGKRLKSADRILGDLPFVTAGEANEGISDFIGNNVHIFSKNTTTIDMFGSAKYRNYEYGGDDHVAVVHTERLPKNAAIFVTTSIHKSSHNGQFDYGRNFYAKDADELNILLPSKDGKPDIYTMNNIVSAIHKIVIKELVYYTRNYENGSEK